MIVTREPNQGRYLSITSYGLDVEIATLAAAEDPVEVRSLLE